MAGSAREVYLGLRRDAYNCRLCCQFHVLMTNNKDIAAYGNDYMFRLRGLSELKSGDADGIDSTQTQP